LKLKKHVWIANFKIFVELFNYDDLTVFLGSRKIDEFLGIYGLGT